MPASHTSASRLMSGQQSITVPAPVSDEPLRERHEPPPADDDRVGQRQGAGDDQVDRQRDGEQRDRLAGIAQDYGARDQADDAEQQRALPGPVPGQAGHPAHDAGDRDHQQVDADEDPEQVRATGRGRPSPARRWRS